MPPSKCPSMLKARERWNRLPNVGWVGAAINTALISLIQVPTRTDFKQEGGNWYFKTWSKSFRTCTWSKNLKDSEDSVVPYQHHPHSEIWPDCLWMYLPAWWAVEFLFGHILRVTGGGGSVRLVSWGVLEIQWPFGRWAAWGWWDDPRSWRLWLLESSLFSSTLTLAVLLLTILSVILAQWPSQVFSGDPGLTTVAVLLLLLITGVTVIIWRQPKDPAPEYFKVGDFMCLNCSPWMNEVCRLWSLNILCWPKQYKLLKQTDHSLTHTQCFTYTISIGTECTAWKGLESSHPCRVGFPFQTSRVCSEINWLPTGPCSACPPTGEHLCEHLPNDADDPEDLDPIWHLECHW